MRVHTQTLILISFLVSLSIVTNSIRLFPSVAGFDPSTDILFEYGAESGVVEPPWNHFLEQCSGYATTTSDVAHSGSKAIELVISNHLSQDRSISGIKCNLNDYNDPTTYPDLYFSWWVYAPAQTFFTSYNGSMSLARAPWDWFKNKNDGYHYNFRTGQAIQYRTGGSKWFTGGASLELVETHEWDTIYSWDTPAGISWSFDTWFHMQTHVKRSEGTDGLVETWINNQAVTPYIQGGLDGSGRTAYNSLYDPTYSYTHFVWLVTNYVTSVPSTLWGTSVTTYLDDLVVATEKVSETYEVGYPSVEFEKFEDGFNDGTLDAWTDTQLVGGWITPVTSPTHKGDYSAKFNVTGDANKVARLIQYIQPVENITIRSWVYLNQLPVDGSNFDLLRIGNGTGDWMGIGRIRNNTGNYYWQIGTQLGSNETVDNSIQINQWYGLELSMVANSTGYVRLYVNDTLTCEKTGDFSGYGEIEYAYPQLYDATGQGSEVVVYHDTIIIDQGHIGLGTPRIFQVATYSADVEESGYSAPIENVKINGTYQTDANGYYEWANLNYNTVYCFEVECPTSYYPAWCVNVEDRFNWNGTHYLLLHNVTEGVTGYIEIYFQGSVDPYVYSATDTLSSVVSGFLLAPSQASMSLTVSASSGATSSTVIHTQGNGRPWTVDGATWSYNPETDLLDLSAVHASERVVSVDWQEIIVTPSNETDRSSGSVGTDDMIAVTYEQGVLPLVGLVAVVGALGLISGTAIYKNAVAKGKRRIRGLKPPKPKKKKRYQPREF